MATILYLIRHGETEGGEIKRYKGSIDVPLSDKGIKQMERLARFLNRSYKSYRTYNAVYCSDLIRAVKSAEIISKPYSLKPIVVPALRERNFGIWEGMSFDEIKEIHPEEFEAWAENPLKFSPIGGESTLEVKDRVINSLNRIIGKHENERIVIVSHGGVNRIIICHLLGIPLENIFRIEQEYGALNIIELWDKYPVAKLINGVILG